MKATAIQVYEGTSLRQITEVTNAGEIVIVSGMEDVHIGDTIATVDCPEALTRISVDEPTIGMHFSANTSPFSGKEGKLVQPQKIAARLRKETLSNVSLQVEEAPGGESFLVKGRGELQLAIVIETMRREGFELTIGRPQILFKEANGKKLEPIEHVYIDCDEGHVGSITETLSTRKGRMTSMVNHGSGRVRLEFSVPSRALIGYRNEFLTSTRGTGILNSSLEGYEEYRGDFPSRQTGSLVSDREGVTNPYGLFNLEPRGNLFVKPSDPVYLGMIVGEHNRPVDLNVNPCKEKKLTNVRASGKDENVQLTPITPLTLERAIEFIREDEQVEVTPKSIRLRKQCLDPNGRKDRL
jgi:GTP-binding protein